MRNANLYTTVLFVFIIFGVSALGINAQDNTRVKYDQSGQLKYILFDKKEIGGNLESPSSANDFFSNILGTKAEDRFIVKSKFESSSDSYYEHYRQYYKDVEVENGLYILHFNKGRVSKANGHYVNTGTINPTPSLTPEQACKLYAEYLNISNLASQKFVYGLVISEIKQNPETEKLYDARLCYKIDLLDTPDFTGETGYIDAHTGKVLKTQRNLMDYTATGTFYTLYSGQKSAKTEYYDGNYHLNDYSRGADINTRDMNDHQFNFYASTSVEFTDDNNTWTVEEHSTNDDQMALDIHWAMQEIYDYFDDEHGLQSFDDSDHTIDSYVHCFFPVEGGITRDNAAYYEFADGYEAFFFGDGQLYNNPLASLDVVAHEFGHAISNHFIGLDPNIEIEKAFGEGFSDIWGVVVENEVAPEKDHWKIGEEVIDVSGDNCLRNIQVPESAVANAKIADTFEDDIYTSGGAYAKSGVMSHWFYLLASGGLGSNDNNDDYIVYALGIDESAKIVYKGQTGHFAAVDSYSEARTAMINAAETVYSTTNTFPSLQVANAWYAVGVGSNPGQVSLSGNKVICNSGTIITANNSPTGSAISWTTSSNLEVHSGGSTSSPTFKPKYTSSGGDGWVQANYTNSGVTFSGPRKNVGVNQPFTSDVELALYTNTGSPVSYMCANKHYHIYLNNSSGCFLSNYSWSVPSAWSVNYTYSNMISVYTNSLPGGMVEVYANTCCGQNKKIVIDYFSGGYCSSYYSLNFSPNPTSGETIVTIEQTTEGEEYIENSATTSKTEDDNMEWDIEIFDSNQILKLKRDRLIGGSATIQTAGWNTGIYFVRVRYNNEIVTGKLIVN